jgi:hypothetical protein
MTSEVMDPANHSRHYPRDILRETFSVRSLLLASAMFLTLGAAAPATSAPATPATRLDHILLWGRSIDEVTSIMAVKLGFQVRAGRDPGGVANRYVRFADTSFIELLGITRPNPDFDPGMREDQMALRGGPGARTFGFRSSGLDAIRASLKGLGYAVTPLFTGPDSPKPGGTKPGWRLFAFERAPLSSNSFFIDYNAGYAPDQADPANTADWRVTREHPNSVRALSAIWLVSADAEPDRKQLERMGFGGAVQVRRPEIGAKGFCVPVGPTALLILQPDGAGVAADVVARGGSRVLGVSFSAADLGRAQRWVERGYERKLTRYPGLSGESFLAPTQDDLGMLIEFHALTKAKGPCSAA